MKEMNYENGMRQIASQIGIDKIASSPMVLPSVMADFWLPRKDIEIMQIAMGSSCAAMLLTQIRDMRGTQQDYQSQKTMLMKESYLGEEPAHRVLVGLWAMVGKDIENRGREPGSQAGNEKDSFRYSENREVERDRNEEQCKEQQRNEKLHTGTRWGHGKLYLLLMYIAEFLGIMIGSAVIMEILFSNGIGNDIDGVVIQGIVSIALYILAHILDRKDMWHIKRSQTTLFTVQKVLPKGSGPWGIYYLKLASWIAWAILSVAGGYAFHNDWIFLACLVMLFVTPYMDILFDAAVHNYLAQIGAKPEDLRK